MNQYLQMFMLDIFRKVIETARNLQEIRLNKREMSLAVMSFLLPTIWRWWQFQSRDLRSLLSFLILSIGLDRGLVGSVSWGDDSPKYKTHSYYLPAALLGRIQQQQ